ncbi:MAG: tetratricopeptide repeat protein [Blastocatellia bacterium]|nr:tetratricopeptide repeat protein [Blastocatellia bacterium]
MDNQTLEIFSKYPKCRKQFKNMKLELLCQFEEKIGGQSYFPGIANCEKEMTREEALELIKMTIKEKTNEEHDRVMNLEQKGIRTYLTSEEYRWIALHKNRCEKCNRIEISRNGHGKHQDFVKVSSRDITPKYFVIKDSAQEVQPKPAKSFFKDHRKKIAIAASVIGSIIVVVLLVNLFIGSSKQVNVAKTGQEQANSKQEVQTTKKRTSQEIMKFADQYEEASKKLKENASDLDALVSRAEAAEELNLPAKALEDYQSYLKLATDVSSRTMAEGKVTKLQEAINNTVKPKATNYEKLDSFLNYYLLMFIQEKTVEAKDQLETVQALATLMMKDSNEKVGVDQVAFYSKLSIDTAKELLEARLETKEVSEVVAIDHFQDSIDKLYKAREVFVRHGAVADAQTASFLLVKFLPKAGRLAEARAEIDQWLNLTKEKGYLFNYAQMLLWDGQLNIYERKEQEAVRKFQECIQVCETIDAQKFALQPLFLISLLYISADENESAFTKSVEGVEGSSTYSLPILTSQFFQSAGLAATGLKKPLLAKAYLENSVKVCEKEGLIGYGLIAKAALSSVLSEIGETSKAIDLIEQAKIQDIGKIADPTAKKHNLLHLMTYEGKVYGLAKQFAKSEKAYRETLQAFKEFGQENFLRIGQLRKGLGEALFEQGKKPEALEQFKLAREEMRKVNEGLHPKNQNQFLDLSFSGKSLDLLIKEAQSVQP